MARLVDNWRTEPRDDDNGRGQEPRARGPSGHDVDE